MQLFSFEDVKNRAGDAKFLKTCAVFTTVQKDVILELCKIYPEIPFRLKSELVNLIQRTLPQEEQSPNLHYFNCWGTFDLVGNGGLMLYGVNCYNPWARIRKALIFTDKEQQLHLGVIRRAMQLNHV